jgi:hypothetical protein
MSVSEYGTVGPVRSRAHDLPAQHRDLMAEDQDLRVLAASLRASSTSQPNTRTIWMGTAVPAGDRSVATITLSPSRPRTRFGRPVTVETSCPVSD